MLNSVENYERAGEQAAVARNQRDESRAEHWQTFFKRMRANESEADKGIASEKFEAAYKRHRQLPTVGLP